MKILSESSLQFAFLLLCKYLVICNGKGTYCDYRYDQLTMDWKEQVKRCHGVQTDCCEDQRHSLKRRVEEQQMICPHEGNTCKKDVLLIVDMSRSINQNPGDFDKMKNFVTDFVKSKSLRVGKDGVHVAFMIFSENKERGREVLYPVKGNEKTKMVVTFGQSASYNIEQLVEEIDKTIVKSALGGSTRTDVALRLANKVFPHESPLNHRIVIDDVVILVTDGAPTMRYFLIAGKAMSTIGILKGQADDLKNKDVKVIGVGIGEEFTTKVKNRKLLKDVTSPDQFYSVGTDQLNEIIDSLVAKSCGVQW